MMSISDNDKSSEVGLQGRCEDDGEHPGDETDLEEVFFQRLIFRWNQEIYILISLLLFLAVQ